MVQVARSVYYVRVAFYTRTASELAERQVVRLKGILAVIVDETDKQLRLVGRCTAQVAVVVLALCVVAFKLVFQLALVVSDAQNVAVGAVAVCQRSYKYILMLVVGVEQVGVERTRHEIVLGEHAVRPEIDAYEVVERQVGIIPAYLCYRVALPVVITVAEGDDVLVTVAFWIAVDIC